MVVSIVKDIKNSKRMPKREKHYERDGYIVEEIRRRQEIGEE